MRVALRVVKRRISKYYSNRVTAAGIPVLA
jgi:hypothetical protein